MNVLILKKNNKTAKIVADTEANLLDLYKLIDVLKARNSKDTFDIKCIAADIKGTKVIKSNYELGLNGDGSTRISKATADAIGKAFDRVGISSDDIDWNDDSEWKKTRAALDRINKMS